MKKIFKRPYNSPQLVIYEFALNTHILNSSNQDSLKLNNQVSNEEEFSKKNDRSKIWKE